MGAQGDQERGGAGQWPRSGQPGTRAERGCGPDPGEPVPASCDAYRYAIRVQGHLDAHWSEWLGGMTITHEEGGVTYLQGVVVDQAALHGLLNKLRDLCLTVLSVQRLDAVVPLEGDDDA